MGLSNLVYPGANHTRFHHALGSMHLMQKAVSILRIKGVTITEEEENAVYCAILLHDIGHGPFSHALEHSIVTGIHHEAISLKFIESLNTEFGGQLDLAIAIFKGSYPRKFLNQLIASQLDMDRLDYLKRDSFYTGVAEGNINSDRILTMLNVADERLVIEEKGIYSIEKFIVARRLMYWSVYLHKTGFVAEKIMERILKRAKELTQAGILLKASEPLSYFLKNSVTNKNFDADTLKMFARLDDYDLLAAIKEWISVDDHVLSTLSENLINRRLPKIEIQNEPFAKTYLKEKMDIVSKTFNLSTQDLPYFVFTGTIENQAYDSSKNRIGVLYKSGLVKDVVQASDNLNLKSLDNTVFKYYICYPKNR